jgi:predicted nucleic acid-binding protein
VGILVDTSVWSLAFRRSQLPAGLAVAALEEVIRQGQAVMVGPIRQELLSGVRGAAQFRRLAEALEAFPDETLVPEDYVEAARCFNRCRAKGVQGSNTDFLLCAIALRRDYAILTTDLDFRHYGKVLRMKLVLKA